MKKWSRITFLILSLISFYFLKSVYTQSVDSNVPIELRIQNLKDEIKKEEEAIEALKRRYRSILKKREKLQNIIEREDRRIIQIRKRKQDNLKRQELWPSGIEESGQAEIRDEQRYKEEREKEILHELNRLISELEQKDKDDRYGEESRKRSCIIDAVLSRIEQIDTWVSKNLW